MIVDTTGIELTPGNRGKDCLGNGEHFGENGELIECCCDECDYMMCCMDDFDMAMCFVCDDKNCPRRFVI